MSDTSDSLDTDLLQKNVILSYKIRKCTLTVEYIAVLWVATLIFENKMQGMTKSSAKYMASSWLFMHRQLRFGNSTRRFCNAMSNFDKCYYIRCLCAEFAAKHTKAPLSLTTHWKMEPDFGLWQSSVISCSHLYRGTIAWTPTNHDILRGHCNGFSPSHYLNQCWNIVSWNCKKQT